MLIPLYCHLPVSWRSLVDRCGSLGSCKLQIVFLWYFTCNHRYCFSKIYWPSHLAPDQEITGSNLHSIVEFSNGELFHGMFGRSVFGFSTLCPYYVLCYLGKKSLHSADDKSWQVLQLCVFLYVVHRFFLIPWHCDKWYKEKWKKEKRKYIEPLRSVAL